MGKHQSIQRQNSQEEILLDHAVMFLNHSSASDNNKNTPHRNLWHWYGCRCGIEMHERELLHVYNLYLLSRIIWKKALRVLPCAIGIADATDDAYKIPARTFIASSLGVLSVPNSLFVCSMIIVVNRSDRLLTRVLDLIFILFLVQLQFVTFPRCKKVVKNG